eukprot:TRINITY_DN9253_c0_g1_i1.p1 TRINITY_DN9253_c0_g1~~TRINITY_DN9253_c0_g1_i1.p1  ORF type:complete len:504 (-),score=86.43 TRINITY_DN9253_c0_g1_i1:165-1676(-)
MSNEGADEDLATLYRRIGEPRGWFSETWFDSDVMTVIKESEHPCASDDEEFYSASEGFSSDESSGEDFDERDLIITTLKRLHIIEDSSPASSPPRSEGTTSRSKKIVILEDEEEGDEGDQQEDEEEAEAEEEEEEEEDVEEAVQSSNDEVDEASADEESDVSPESEGEGDSLNSEDDVVDEDEDEEEYESSFVVEDDDQEEGQDAYCFISDDDNDNDVSPPTKPARLHRRHSFVYVDSSEDESPTAAQKENASPNVQPTRSASIPTKPRPTIISTPSHQRNFHKTSREAAAQLYAQFNKHIFEDKLPKDLLVEWSSSLNTTAGKTHCRVSDGVYVAHIELATKVVDTLDKLQNTLCHEMCHVAVWVLDHVSRPPHGSSFKYYARLAMRKYPHLSVTTCHNYEIHYKYRYNCSNPSCTVSIGRHSKSLDTSNKVCGRCRSKLELAPRLLKDGTPAKPRTPSAFSVYVKDNMASVRRDMPGSTQKDLMTALADRYRETKALSQDV